MTANKEPAGSPAIILLSSLLTGAGLLASAAAYAYFATHPRRQRLSSMPEKYGLTDYQAITFKTQDGLQIKGWFIPTKSNRVNGVVILCHGYPMNRCEMLPHARMLHDAGFHTLLFDFRALGESEGSLCSIGYHEQTDVSAALDYLMLRPDTRNLPVGILGHSMGAAAAILTAEHDQRVRAMVAESPYPDLQDAIEARFRWAIGPAVKPISVVAATAANKYLHFKPADVSPMNAISKLAPRPLLLIGGRRDLLVRWRDLERMQEAAGKNSRLWLLPKSHHAHCVSDEPEEYAEQITSFFRESLNPITLRMPYVRS